MRLALALLLVAVCVSGVSAQRCRTGGGVTGFLEMAAHEGVDAQTEAEAAADPLPADQAGCIQCQYACWNTPKGNVCNEIWFDSTGRPVPGQCPNMVEGSLVPTGPVEIVCGGKVVKLAPKQDTGYISHGGTRVGGHVNAQGVLTGSTRISDLMDNQRFLGLVTQFMQTLGKSLTTAQQNAIAAFLCGKDDGILQGHPGKLSKCEMSMFNNAQKVLQMDLSLPYFEQARARLEREGLLDNRVGKYLSDQKCEKSNLPKGFTAEKVEETKSMCRSIKNDDYAGLEACFAKRYDAVKLAIQPLLSECQFFDRVRAFQNDVMGVSEGAPKDVTDALAKSADMCKGAVTEACIHQRLEHCKGLLVAWKPNAILYHRTTTYVRDVRKAPSAPVADLLESVRKSVPCAAGLKWSKCDDNRWAAVKPVLDTIKPGQRVSTILSGTQVKAMSFDLQTKLGVGVPGNSDSIQSWLKKNPVKAAEIAAELQGKDGNHYKPRSLLSMRERMAAALQP